MDEEYVFKPPLAYSESGFIMVDSDKWKSDCGTKSLTEFDYLSIKEICKISKLRMKCQGEVSDHCTEWFPIMVSDFGQNKLTR